jgi:adenylosuccinate synthase
MTVTAVVGAQWGDEGKGRVVDYLAQKANMVIRFQGGDNAGHTVVNSYGTFKLHLVPSGIFNPTVQCIIGAGTVVNSGSLLDEMKIVTDAGVSVDNLWIDRRAHMVLPHHRQLDSLQETARGGRSLGTTKRGIGPCYADKAARQGLQMGDLLHPEWLRERLDAVVPRINVALAQYQAPSIDADGLYAQLMEWASILGPRIIDTLPMIQDAHRWDKEILLEGQLGVMRDLDWGIYPFVTSSNPTASGACIGAGLPATALNRVIGVVKAYSTAVGTGPFPVELFDENGEKLRDVGKEYGATTGRPRRCGWFDGVAIKYAAWLSGFTGIAVTKLDVLDDFEKIQVCVRYKHGDQVLNHLPETATLENVEPVYEIWDGWCESTRNCRTWEDLPKTARLFLHRISELAGAPIQFISVGPEREELVVR